MGKSSLETTIERPPAASNVRPVHLIHAFMQVRLRIHTSKVFVGPGLEVGPRAPAKQIVKAHVLHLLRWSSYTHILLLRSSRKTLAVEGEGLMTLGSSAITGPLGTKT